MSRSHPPTLLTLAERTLRDDALLVNAGAVLVAVSGGPDSMALLHVLARLGPKHGVEVVAHGIDHGLRTEARAELDLARRLATSLDVPFSTTKIAVPEGPNLQARARRARLDALRAAMEASGATRIATGHHADDRAETVLMRILRGTGPAGLSALPSRAGHLIRPLIRARRSDVLLHLERHHITTAEDPSNRDPRFLRSRVRHEVLPLLESLSPKIVEHLCSLADDSAQDLALPTIPDRIAGHALGRAHREALGYALRHRKGEARVALPGGAVAGVELATRRIVLVEKD